MSAQNQVSLLFDDQPRVLRQIALPPSFLKFKGLGMSSYCRGFELRQVWVNLTFLPYFRSSTIAHTLSFLSFIILPSGTSTK